MKANTHPSYSQQTFTCSCGNVIQVASTMSGQGIEICSNCHPFYTGKQKMIDSAGRIERFASRYTSIVGGKRKSRKEEKSDKETTEKASAE